MASTSTNDTGSEAASGGLIARIRDAYWPAGPPIFRSPRAPRAAGEPEIIPPERRKAAMVSLEPGEVRWAFIALLVTLAAGIAIPTYITAQNKVTRAGKNSIAVAPDAWLLGGALIALSLIGLGVLWRRRRTLIAFDLFLIGFGFTLFIGLAGFLFILLGGWLMLRAWRINKYGTTNSKAIARQAAERPRGRDRKRGGSSTAAAGSTSSKAADSGPRKAPQASKRYTPKAPPRRKVPKPTE
jgi:hypothetical protein